MTLCVAVGSFHIDANCACIGGQLLDGPLDALGVQEGFADWDDMYGWFAASHGPEFDGVITTWTDFLAQADGMKRDDWP